MQGQTKTANQVTRKVCKGDVATSLDIATKLIAVKRAVHLFRATMYHLTECKFLHSAKTLTLSVATLLWSTVSILPIVSIANLYPFNGEEDRQPQLEEEGEEVVAQDHLNCLDLITK